MEGTGCGLIEVLFRHLPGGARESSVRTTGVPAEIRTENYPNTSLERYRYTYLLGYIPHRFISRRI
jgi:hypothetical protein